MTAPPPPWADLPEASRTRVIQGILQTARYRIRCVLSPPLGGRETVDPELLAEAAADIAGALALGWVDDGLVADLAHASEVAASRTWSGRKRAAP